jgi:hypothetical protein
MTPKISLITAVVVAALAVCVPAALADPWGADRQNETTFVGSPDVIDRAIAAADRQNQTTFAGSPDAIDRAVALKQQQLESMLDARERAYGTKYEVQLGTGVHADAFERAVTAHERTSGFVGDDRFRIDPTSQPGPVSVTGSDRDIQWPQVGIGFGIALALLFGLILALRSRRQPLAH